MSHRNTIARTRLHLLPLECRVNPSFIPRAPVPTDLINSHRLVAGRFNADAFADVGVSNLIEASGPERPPTFEATVSVRTGTGDGGFPESQAITTLPYLNDLITGDFNLDGVSDLAGVSNFFTPGLFVLLGNGDGTYGAPFPAGTIGAFAVATGDFTGDGLPDLVTLGFDGSFNNNFVVFAGDGLGGFTSVSGSTPTSAFGDRILAGDFDGNGTLDVIGLDPFESRQLVVRLGNGDGTFGTADVLTALSDDASDFTVADFDGNGSLDVVVLEGDTAVLRRNIGGGQFEASGTTLATVPNSDLARIATADFDRNGTADVVFVGRNSDTAHVYLNSGAGGFTADARNRTYSVLGGANDVVIADVDGDTNPDFVTLSQDTAGGDVIRAFVSDTPDATVTTLSINPNPIVFGRPVTLTATVQAAVASEGTPQGAVTFRAGATVLGVVPLVNGVAQLVVPNLPAGSYAITAQYGGFTPPTGAAVGSLSGYVYNDFSGDGVKQAFESGIGTTVTLLRVEGGVTSTVGETVTGSNGYYEFTDLPAGTYVIAETQPEGLVTGQNTVGTINGGAGTGSVAGDSFVNVVLTAGDVGQSYNFGERFPGSLSGSVYTDRDNGGSRNGNEPGIAGVTVTLFRLVPNGSGFDEVSVGQTTTDGTGTYQFDDLTPGDYRIRETQPAGFNDGVEGAANFRDATVTSFSTSGNNNFGERVRGALTGFLSFTDLDAVTGPFSGGVMEAVVGGTLFATAVAEADGYYQFNSLPTGTYTLRPTFAIFYSPADAFVGVIDGLPGSGTSSGGVISNLTFTDGQSGQNYNFRVQEESVIGAPSGGGDGIAFALAGVPSAFRESGAGGVLVVNRAPTQSGLTVDSTPVPTGRPMTIRVTAANAGPFGTPFGPSGGLVEVYNGATLLGRGVLGADGTFTLTVLRPAGPLALTASYAGDTNFDGSTSTPQAVAVPDPALFAVGSDNGAIVCIFIGSGELSHGLAALDAGFSSGVRPVLATTNRGEDTDVFVGSGPGSVSRVALVDGATRQQVWAFQPFEDGFLGGVVVASADFDGDGVADVAVSADQGGGPRVRVFLSKNGGVVPVADFFAFEEYFRGGARIAAGDVNRDGVADLVVAAGPGGGPRVAVFDGAALAKGGVLRLGPDFYAFEPTFGGGVYVAVGDTNGDGFNEIICGAGFGGGPRVVAIDGVTFATTGGVNQLASFYARPETDTGGVRVSARDINQDGYAEVIVGAGVDNGARVRAFDGRTLGSTLDPFIDLDAFPGLTAGVYVG